MSRFLANKAKLYGLSKSKIAMVAGIILLVLLLLMLFGIFQDDSSSLHTDNDTSPPIYNHADTTGSINEIINEANQNKAKLVASSIVVTKVESQGDDVPPIAKVKMPEIKGLSEKPEQVNQVEKEFYQKRATNKYNSFAAKTLMFSQPLNKLSELKGGASNPNGNGIISNLGKNGAGSKNNVPTNLPNSSDSSSGNILPNSIFKNSQGQNMQGEKEAFISNSVKDGAYLDSQLQSAKSPYEVKAGSVIPATMINGLNSDLPGQIIALVRENVYDSVSRRYLLIPQGAKLIGLYDSNIAYGQERVLVIWNRLIYPNGDSINLKAMPGTDLEGYAGFHDIVDNKYWQIFGTSFILGVITGAMQYSQNNTNSNVQIGGIGLNNANPSVGQTLAGSLGQQLGQTGLSIAQKNLNVQPTLIIRPNYPFNVMITADMILKPYPKS